MTNYGAFGGEHCVYTQPLLPLPPKNSLDTTVFTSIVRFNLIFAVDIRHDMHSGHMRGVDCSAAMHKI